MKLKLPNPSILCRRSRPSAALIPAIAGLLLTLLPGTQAANVFWDTNGVTAGAGDPAFGTWGVDAFWNTDSAGGAGTFSSVVGAANAAIFSAGSDAVGAFSVSVIGTNLAQSVSFQEGTPTLSGAGVIALTKATSSGAAGGTLRVDNTVAGTATVSCGVDVDAVASGNSILQLVVNDSATASPDLLLSGTVRKLGTTGTFLVRAGGAGSTRITSALSAFSTFQPLSVAPALGGPVTIAGNQSMGSGSFDQPSGTTVAAGAQYIFGDSLSDVQSWGSMNIDNATPTLGVIIRSAATTSGNITLARGAKMQIPGSLNCLGTFNIGSANGIGALTLSDLTTAGSASFGGLTVGAFVGSTIVGGAPGTSTLTISNNSAATVSANLTIGGGGANENNIQLNKRGAGTLTLGGSHSYTGPTVVTGGRLDLTATIASSVTVSNNASMGGEGSTSGSITFGSGTANLFFDPVSAGVLTANTIAASGTVIVNPSSSASGVVMQSTTTPNGITGTVGVNYISGARGTLSLNGAKDTLSFTPGIAAALKWKGAANNPTFWDVITTTNWNNGGSTDRFYSGDSVTFDDSASSFAVAIQNGSVAPSSTVISNNANAYTISNGSIIGTGGVTKNGSNSATVLFGGHAFTGGLTVNNGTLNLLGAANTFTGGVTNNGGSLVISNINQIGATGGGSSLNSINVNGGTLSYTGPTITSDTLILNLLGGTSAIEVTDTNATLRTGAAVTGTGNLIKRGDGTLALGKNSVQTPLGNTFTGKITVTGGQLDIRQSDSLGATSGITEFTNATLYLDPFGQPSGMTFDPEPLVFSGNSFIRNFNQGTTASQIDVLTGPITNNGALGIFSQTNGAYGELQIAGNIVNGPGSSLNFGSNNAGVSLTQNQIVNVSGSISGPASVSAQGGPAATYTLANNNYTGNTIVNSGTLVLQQATLASNSSVTIGASGVLKLDFGPVTNTIGTLTLNGVGQNPGTYDAVNAAPYLTGAGSLLVTALPIANYQTNITWSVSGSTLSLSWPATHLGWILQGQTNSLSTGITATWSDIPATAAVTSTNLPINPANPTVFFRLRHP